MARSTFPTARAFLPETHTLSALSAAAAGCRGCDLYERATRTVFGEGPPTADAMFVGEQPGDAEDKAGHPFVGPAGRLLDKALVEAGFKRDAVYVTNAVKHFNWEPAGGRRLHKKPRAGEVTACRPWLEAEIEAVRPRLIVLLGATAAGSILGSSFHLMASRGQFVKSELAPLVMATIHPSALLRAPDAETRHAETARFIAELRSAREALERL